ncbi:MAG: helix-turn-helix domain-containing protein [Deltaproteobacteria bacterium]|nr:helix-turn-helix domain-containing protein [Deltaproteobacteria bacterium]
MAKKLFRPGKILSDQEVKKISAAMHYILDPRFLEQGRKHGLNVEEIVRFQAVSYRCKEAREKLEMSIKEVALALKVPQYKLRAIEKGSLKQIEPEVLQKLLAFLGLKRWFRRWKEANPQLAKRIDI